MLAPSLAAPGRPGRGRARWDADLRQLDAAADAAAGALWALGVRPGDRVAACLPNDLDVVVAFHGTQRIGAIWAGIGEALTAVEQQALADAVAPAVILAGPNAPWTARPWSARRRWTAAHRRRHPAPAVRDRPARAGRDRLLQRHHRRPKAVVHSQHNLLLPAPC